MLPLARKLPGSSDSRSLRDLFLRRFDQGLWSIRAFTASYASTSLRLGFRHLTWIKFNIITLNLFLRTDWRSGSAMCSKIIKLSVVGWSDFDRVYSRQV